MEFAAEYGLWIGITCLVFSLLIIYLPYWFQVRERRPYWVTGAFGAVVMLFGMVNIIGSFLASDMAGDRQSRVQMEQQEPRAPQAPEGEDPEGEPAPDQGFERVSGNGGEGSLSDYEGQVVLLNYWATWCAPCVHEMPALSELSQEYPDDLVVLCISDEDEQQVHGFLDDFEPLDQEIAILGDHQVADAFSQMRYIRPMSYVIDRQGRIQEVIRGARDYDQFLEKVEPYL